MTNTASSPTITIVLVNHTQRAVVLGNVPRPPEPSPRRLSALVRERTGADTVLLHDGGLMVSRATGPVVMEVLDELPGGLPAFGGWHPPANARPWQRPGWFAQVSAWLVASLAARGEHLTGALHQISSYDRACVLRADSDGGGVYVKAGDGLEAAVTAYVADNHPQLTVRVLAQEGERDWLVSRDSGRRLSEQKEPALWRDALAKLAHFQQTANADDLTTLGCPTHPFAELADRAEGLLRNTEALRMWGLADADLTSLEALVWPIRRAHTRVAALGLGMLAAHGDAQPMNALCSAEGCVWFDWSEASVAHPLMDVGWCLAWLSHPSRAELALRRTHPDALSSLWSAYLAALGVRGAARLLPETMTLALAHRALVYHDRFYPWKGTVLGWRPQYVPYYLRLLRRIAKQPDV